MQWTCVFDFKKILLAIGTFMLLCLSASAQESLITSVAISKPKDLNGAYQLTVKADKPLEYKEKAESSDSIYFDFKNAVAVDSLDTIYDNVSGIDAVIVQQLDKNKVRIYVNGVNTADTKLILKTKQQTGSNASNQITLNRPMREYRPTNDINEIGEENIDWDENSFNTEHLFSSFFGLFGAKSDMTLVVCIILLAACVIVSRKVFARVKLNEEPLIGLSSAYKTENVNTKQDEQEKIPFAQYTNQAPLMGNLKNQPVKQSLNLYQKQKVNTKVAPNSLKQNIALNAYRSAQKNPYVSRAVQSKQLQQVSYQKRTYNKPVAQGFTSKVQNNTLPVQNKQGASVESIKFLESVTKIYEQSGRKDLAQGLRDGINKRKSAV